MQNVGQNWKTSCGTNNVKMENNEFKIVSIKNRTCFYLDDIIKIEDLDFDNILLDKKSYENVLIYNISSQTFIY